ncbi:hypothetical protein U4E84_09925 [Halorubrum sp. AD140]|uniref:hypothetical protein n=1 Tax=Halorubrum sp. AD140 TaxID=3050073 RepID=UPI002ACC5A19|nr:hypothetical protein [Halorubrum sp. AD140]MDZ5811659.1 hypothetical protein [Halorubrum sp. AD140]
MHRRRFIRHTVSRIATLVVAAVAIDPIETARAAGSAYAAAGTETPASLPTGVSTGVTREITGDEYLMEYRWDGSVTPGWTLRFGVGRRAYRSAARRTLGYDTAFDAARRNPFARELAAELDTATPTAPPSETMSLDVRRFDRAVEFVRSLPYRSDYESQSLPDYHRTVEETLVDGCGDCKDHTYLLAGLLSYPPFEYRTAMVFVPDHMLLGVAKSDLPEAYADAPTLANTNYVAVESVTGEPIGEYDDGPVLAVYDDGFAYLDRSAVADTAVDFLRDPAEFEVVAGASG